MAKRGRKKNFYKFDDKKLTSRQKMYLESNYGKGVYGRKKYNEVMQELKIIEKGSIYDIDLLVAKREFSGDKRIFNKATIDPSKEQFGSGLANSEGEVLDSYIPINNDYSLAYLTIPGYNNSPIKTTRIISANSIGDYTYEE